MVLSWKERTFGHYGPMVEKLDKQPNPTVGQPYSMSLLAAISQQEVMAVQLVEGGVDTSVFDNFIYELLLKVRADRKNDDRPVILFMDNATIHRKSMVVQTILGMKVFLLYTPQYSPQLNPVERFFKYVKSVLKDRPTLSK
jgi:hypothetical protein